MSFNIRREEGVYDSFQPSVLSLLDFDKLLHIISGYSFSESSKSAILGIIPFSSAEDISNRQRLVSEIMKMSQQGGPLRISEFQDIAPLLGRVRPEGAVLDAIELYSFIPVLSIASALSDQIASEDGLSYLKELASGLTGFPDILRILKRSVDSEGNILDTASSLLSGLREQIRRLDSRIGKRLEEMVRDERVAVFLQDDFITKRSGRWVIPVRMDSKGQVSGVVHDVSKSGETAFVEPLAIINLSNELENIIAEAKAEEIRILRNLSSKIREAADGIDTEYKTIVRIDVLNAISGFADSLRMEVPLINDEDIINISRGRHPLLQLSFKKTGGQKEVVPLDISLGGDNTMMIITGSNAGGKTIAIKTLGLLLLMALSGMPVPADSSSSFPLVQDLLVDIGDEQSIENNLSTFSAHISNISRILKKAGARSLVLLDELGTGTDPDEGAALACAVLKELKNTCPLVFATTHLADIKGFVHRTTGMLNASMEFDGRTLTPLYRLRIGEPGQSHALETARRYGLPDSVIDSARALLGGVKVEFDNLVADLNRKRSEYEEALEQIIKQKTAIEQEKGLLEKRLADAELNRKETLAKAYKEASDVVLDTKRQMSSLLEEIKKAARAKNREAMQVPIKKAEIIKEHVREKLREYDTSDTAAPSIEEISEGDTVFVKSLGYDAPVVKVIRKERRIKVRAGNMEIDLPISDIRNMKGRPLAREKSISEALHSDETVSSRTNLVGLRVDEALSKLEPFLNHASLAGLAEVTIIHGFGTGALSKAVRMHLEGHPLVKKYRPGDRTEGGDGVTVVTTA